VVVDKNVSPRTRLDLARDSIKFLKNEESKVLEFWEIWYGSIPEQKQLTQSSDHVDYYLSCSADMTRLTWRVGGPQNVFIQKMVDFFWNVGAPESEIDRLNDVGANINPQRIGSWIDMSKKGGMDGGWYFPVEISMTEAIKAADPGESRDRFENWATSKEILNVLSVGRDMGAAPPRQTEYRLKLPGPTFSDQLEHGLDAWTKFEIPRLSEDVVKIMRSQSTTKNLLLSVITSSEGFVRIGILIPAPTKDTVISLCNLANINGQVTELSDFETTIHCESPSYVEYQFLNSGFGYGVYKEGFDIVFHYNLGSEFGSM